MSSPNHSTCLIDLSATIESPTSKTVPLIRFPPISADEMIVPLIKRFSISNTSSDPFDTLEKQAELFGDPFEIVNITKSPRDTINKVVSTATLLDLDGSGNSIELSPDSQNNSADTLNKGMCTISSITTNSSLADANVSDPMNQAFVNTGSSELNGTHRIEHRNRISSDPATSKPSKSKRKVGSGKARCASLEQLCLKNQFRKSMTNSPGKSPNWSKANKPASSLESSLIQKQSSSVTDFNLTSESIFDDLLSTNPEWIESDNESDSATDSDFERMTIPFLKNMQDNESTIASTSNISDRSTAIEKLSKFRKTCEAAAAEVVESANTSEDKPIDRSSQVDNITSIIETLRSAVENCGDAKKKSEVAALLDNLNVCLKTNTSDASPNVSDPEPRPFVRQRTFSVDDQLQATEKTSPDQVPKELSNSMPVASVQTRRSISGTTSITTPRRFSRSLTYAGKPVSVVSAVQSQSDSADRRRSSVCTTPTRLVTGNPRSTRTSLSRQSLSYSQDEKPVIKPVQRKTIMKTSNPVPSTAVTKPLKLRVGEQTKPSGPLRAVVPYQRSSTLNDSEVSTKAKRMVKTSTPLAPNNISKSSIPAAASTPVINTGKPAPLSQFRHTQSRLSYTPSTPIANSVNRQPSTERKKRSVTFSEESDKLSRSLIVGAKESSFQPMYPLQRRRLSQSYGINKENSILQKK